MSTAAGPERDLAELRAEVERLRGVLPERVDVDPERVEEGLVRLVLSLVEFLRELLERQAVRRMEGGALSEEEVERMGSALMRLDAKMDELAAYFGIPREELNLRLGPLGSLR
ncbi:MAG TPA: gas vesicle protein K [Candidatus Limnocylindrales bacterium]|nr:gas vesicle protein K [Candidatus Limnocylindrales bacterium]